MENLENILNGICPTCGEESEFKYLGEQEMFNKPPIQLYNCGLCKSTIELAGFYNKNQNPKASSH